MQYLLHDYPHYEGLLSRSDLQALVENGSVDPQSPCTDVRSSRVMVVGEALGLHTASGAAFRQGLPSRRQTAARYQEFGPDNDPHWPQPSAHWNRPAGDEDGSEDEDSGLQWLYFSHPSWFRHLRALTLALGLLVAAFSLLKTEEGYALFCFLLGCCLLLWIMMRRQTHEFVVTEDRLEHGWGLLSRSSREVLIRDIRSLDVRQSGLLGLLGYGTLEVASVAQGGVALRFECIRRPHRVKELIRELQRRPENGWAQSVAP